MRDAVQTGASKIRAVTRHQRFADAFNPKTGLVYVNSWEIPRIMKYTKFDFVLGTGSTGVETSFRTLPAGEPWGYHIAFNPITGKTEWKVPVTGTVISAGMLATDGGLLFTGRLNGEFIALDQASGEMLWKFKTGSGINSPPMTTRTTAGNTLRCCRALAGCSTAS
jgi:alcohol dehydrogenase (cytochrome c)